MLNRAFFSLQRELGPDQVALGNLFLNGILDFAFYRYGTWGIPLSTAIVNIAGTAALLAVIRKRLGGIEGRQTAAAGVRIAIASAAAAGIAFAVWEPLDSALGRSFPAQVVSLGLALAAAGAVYLGSCRLLGVRELELVISLRRRVARSI